MTKIITCSDCGQKNISKLRFCTRCGVSLRSIGDNLREPWEAKQDHVQEPQNPETLVDSRKTSPFTWVVTVLFGLLLLAYIFQGLQPGGHSPTKVERFPGPWQERIKGTGIAKTLVAHDVRGCGFLKFRESSRDKNEYLVYCSRDFENWRAYLVWPRINKVTGPFSPDPTISP